MFELECVWTHLHQLCCTPEEKFALWVGHVTYQSHVEVTAKSGQELSFSAHIPYIHPQGVIFDLSFSPEPAKVLNSLPTTAFLSLLLYISNHWVGQISKVEKLRHYNSSWLKYFGAERGDARIGRWNMSGNAYGNSGKPRGLQPWERPLRSHSRDRAGASLSWGPFFTCFS